MDGLKLSQGTTKIPGGSGGGEDEAKRAQEEQMRRDLLTAVLATPARERCAFFPNQQLSSLLIFHFERPVSRIALVSPARSKEIETILLKMAQSGQLRGQVTEEQLIDLLDQVRISRFTALIESLIYMV